MREARIRILGGITIETGALKVKTEHNCGRQRGSNRWCKIVMGLWLEDGLTNMAMAEAYAILDGIHFARDHHFFYDSVANLLSHFGLSSSNDISLGLEIRTE